MFPVHISEQSAQRRERLALQSQEAPGAATGDRSAFGRLLYVADRALPGDSHHLHAAQQKALHMSSRD